MIANYPKPAAIATLRLEISPPLIPVIPRRRWNGGATQHRFYLDNGDAFAFPGWISRGGHFKFGTEGVEKGVGAMKTWAA